MNPCVVYLAQNTEKDFQYGRDSRSMLERSLDLFFANYNNRFQHHVLIFHEGDFSPKDQLDIAKGRSNIFFKEIQFEVPSILPRHEVPEVWTDGKGSYSGMGCRHMCHFYGYDIFQILLDMGYDWMMRLDDDSFIHTPISYNLFEYMQQRRLRYAYRVAILDAKQSSRGFKDIISAYLKAERIKPTFWKKERVSWGHQALVAIEAFVRWSANHLGVPKEKFFPSALRVYPFWNYYNNFYIADLTFWVKPEVKSFLNFLSRTGGTYKYRWGDHLIQTAAVQLFMPQNEVHQFKEWTYEHASIRKDHLIFGGIYPGKGQKSSKAVKHFKKKYQKLTTHYFWSKA